MEAASRKGYEDAASSGQHSAASKGLPPWLPQGKEAASERLRATAAGTPGGGVTPGVTTTPHPRGVGAQRRKARIWTLICSTQPRTL